MSRQAPHGGTLINLFTEDKDGAKAGVAKTIELTDRQSCDVQLLCNGGFSPLTGFMSEEVRARRRALLCACACALAARPVRASGRLIYLFPHLAGVRQRR